MIPSRTSPSPAAVDAAPPERDDSALVCHCRRITYAEVSDAIEGGVTSLAGIQRATTACTRCFGCRFELQRMLKAHLGDQYTPTPFVSRLTAPPSLGRRVLARLRGTSQVLPRRMYMPVLSGFRGHDVETRVIIFNWHEDGSEDVGPVSLRADVLEPDGTRRAAVTRSVAPRGSVVLDLAELAGHQALEDGVGALKLVLDTPHLGSLRPYFQLVTATGITSTHEKAGPYDPGRIEKRRPYFWIFPVGHSPRPEEAYLFCTNTQAKPMSGHELIWRDEGTEEVRVPFPALELDQSACIPLHEHFPDILDEEKAGSVRLSPATHKVAGFIIRHDPSLELWRVQHL